MKNRSPARIIEICIYVLIIIAAVIWLLTGGRLYYPPGTAPIPTAQPSPQETATPPPIVVPCGDVFPGQ
jgi:hypothetical protein